MASNGATPINCVGIAFAQIVWFELIEPTTSNGRTVIVTVLEVAGFPVVQVSLEVRTQLIALSFAGIKA